MPTIAEAIFGQPINEPEPVALRGVYLKLSHDRWTLTQRPPDRKSRYSDSRIREGRQDNGALVYVVQQVPASVSDEQVVRLANRTILIRHLGKVNVDVHCWCNFAELGEGKIVR